MFQLLILATMFLFNSQFALGNTQIVVVNNFNKNLDIRIRGAGVGGCALNLPTSMNDSSSCNCLAGTLAYSFCAYQPMILPNTTSNSTSPTSPTMLHRLLRAYSGANLRAEVVPERVRGLKCPSLPNETLLCSDRSGLDNCHNKDYTCTVMANGQCNCS